VAFDSVSIFIFYLFLFPFLCFLAHDIVLTWWKDHFLVTWKQLHYPSHGDLILWQASANSYHQHPPRYRVKKPRHRFCKPRFRTWIHTGGPVHIQRSITKSSQSTLLTIFIAIIWRIFQTIAMVETWARNWMSSILKMFQHLYLLHPSIPPTTNYILFDAHAAQEPLTFDSDAVQIGFDTMPQQPCLDG